MKKFGLEPVFRGLPAAENDARPGVSLAECSRRGRGFTLIELLVVVGIIAIMMALAVPAFNAIRGGADFTSEVYDISGLMEQARAYAMANNTFVLAGITEVAAGQSATAKPQVAGTGAIAIALIASKDGTRPYQALLNAVPNKLNTWQTSGYGTGMLTGNGGGFLAVTKLATFPNLHLVDLQGAGASVPVTGNMARHVMPSQEQYYDIPNANCLSGTPFIWPLGVKFGGALQYTFTKVVEFDPQGSARIILGSPSNNLDAIPYCIEIGLQPTHGKAAPTAPGSQTTGQFAAIQIDGMSGATHIFRP